MATKETHKKVTRKTANEIRISAFHRQDTGAEDVNMMSLQRSRKSVLSHIKLLTSSWAYKYVGH